MEPYLQLTPERRREFCAATQRAEWRRDYQAMREAMFFGEVPSFDELMHVAGDFERTFNAG